MHVMWYLPYDNNSRLIHRLRKVIDELGEFDISFKEIIKDFFKTCLTCEWSSPVGDPLDVGYPDEMNSLEMYEKLDNALWDYSIHKLHTFGNRTFEDGDDIDSAEDEAYEFYKACFDEEFDRIISDLFKQYEFSITKIYLDINPTSKLNIRDIFICDETITVVGDIRSCHRKL